MLWREQGFQGRRPRPSGDPRRRQQRPAPDRGARRRWSPPRPATDSSTATDASTSTTTPRSARMLGHGDPGVDGRPGGRRRAERPDGRRRSRSSRSAWPSARRARALGRAGPAHQPAAARRRFTRCASRERPRAAGSSSSRAATTAGTTPWLMNVLSPLRPGRRTRPDVAGHDARSRRRHARPPVQRPRRRRARVHAHPGDVAAIILEPIPHNVGARPAGGRASSKVLRDAVRRARRDPRSSTR